MRIFYMLNYPWGKFLDKFSIGDYPRTTNSSDTSMFVAEDYRECQLTVKLNKIQRWLTDKMTITYHQS